MEFFPAIDGTVLDPKKIARKQARYGLGDMTASSWAVRVSKRLVLREFLRSEADVLLFMEDDCWFEPWFQEDCDRLLSEMPGDWDVAMLGGQNGEDPAPGSARPSPPTADNHCILFSRQGARRTLALLGNVEHAYSDQQLKQAMAAKRVSAWWTGRYSVRQRASFSDNYEHRHSRLPHGVIGLQPDEAWIVAAAARQARLAIEWGVDGRTLASSTILVAHSVAPSGSVIGVCSDDVTLSELRKYVSELPVRVALVTADAHGRFTGQESLQGTVDLVLTNTPLGARVLWSVFKVLRRGGILILRKGPETLPQSPENYLLVCDSLRFAVFEKIRGV